VKPSLRHYFVSLFLLVLVTVPAALFAQAPETVVYGKVTDSGTGDGIPFVNVVFKGTSIGMTTDFDGNFRIKTAKPTDSVMASYIGYKSKAKKIKKGITQQVNFQLVEETTKLQEVVVKAGENPAFPILRGVMKNKEFNDKRKLDAYEYETYSKMEIDVDNISDKLREKKVMKKIAAVLDTLDRMAGEDGKPILPIFISESVSRVYFRDNPKLKTENILKTKVNGVGVEDANFVSQIVGSSLQDYNFYLNWLNFGKKELVSPIADGWRLYYDYELLDSAMKGNDFCYRLDFFPKSEQMLAFTGTMWITKEGFALKQIDATMGSQANINFIEKIKIQMEYEKVEGGAWMPVRSRILIDVGELTSNSAGLLAKFYVSNKNFVINQPKKPSFYDHAIRVEEDASLEVNESVWDSLRHEPLSESDKNVRQMIDTIQNIPIVKSYVDIIKLIINGYYKTGKVWIGPYLGAIAWNNHEGVRLQAGFKTNIKFSRTWQYGAQLAYGFRDQRFKYQAFAKKILSRQQWTTLTFRIRSDLGRLGLDDDYLTEFPLFVHFSRWGRFDKSAYYTEYRVAFERELFKGFQQKVVFRQYDFNPTYNTGFYTNPSDIANSTIINTYNTTEVYFESRYARDQIFLQNDMERLALESRRWPTITLRYTHGFKNGWGGDYIYDKLRLNIYKRVKMGALGNGYLNLTGENVFSDLPYPLLAVHLGNQSRVYTPVSFNLMNFGEFVSDHYASVQYRQNFEGLFLNSLPLIQKLKWRILATTNVMVGGMRDSNKAQISPVTSDGKPTDYIGHLIPSDPYVEVGYGVENIFKFLRIDFVHRLTYLDLPHSRNFGVFASVQIQL
jgi:hypothetical protein